MYHWGKAHNIALTKTLLKCNQNTYLLCICKIEYSYWTANEYVYTEAAGEIYEV